MGLESSGGVLGPPGLLIPAVCFGAQCITLPNAHTHVALQPCRAPSKPPGSPRNKAPHHRRPGLRSRRGHRPSPFCLSARQGENRGLGVNGWGKGLRLRGSPPLPPSPFTSRNSTTLIWPRWDRLMSEAVCLGRPGFLRQFPAPACKGGGIAC